MNLHPDFRDWLSVLAGAQVKYLIIGGYAVGFHARPRFTKDIAIWVEDEPSNLARLSQALQRFGAPQNLIAEVLAAKSTDIVWLGAPPTRIDILRQVDGVAFEEAYPNRVDAEWDGIAVSIIGRDELIKSKKAAGREQDLRDVQALTRNKSKR